MGASSLFRFVQASNLALDRFCEAPAELPPALRRLAVDAPFLAAERVFNSAIESGASFIVLSGGVFQRPEPSTWGAGFLARQCERAARAGITVVWGEATDESFRRWPKYLRHGGNLILLSAGAEHRFTARGIDVRVLCGPSDDIVPARGEGESFQLAIDPGASSVDGTRGKSHFVASQGGVSTRQVRTSGGVLYSPGSTQPRSRRDGETGGCLLVDVGAGYSIGTEFVETGALRWHTGEIDCNDALNWEGFRRQMHSRSDQLFQGTIASGLLTQWTIRGHGPVIERLIRPDFADALRSEVDAALQSRSRLFHTLEIACQPDSVQEARWQREGSSFGTAVRTLQAIDGGSGPTVDLAELPIDAPHTLPSTDRHVARPHFQTGLKSAARRHAARLLASDTHAPD
jgi:hypothetical protein